MEWQFFPDARVDGGTWVFGEKIRGVIRERIGEVWWNNGMWDWEVLGSGEELSPKGFCKEFEYAIRQVESHFGLLG